jgi:thiosulfate/3-mercaptopyruvate sulfurtransferase
MAGVSPLISSAELVGPPTRREHRSRPAVLDVRWRLAGPPGADDYRAGHLPGAVFLSLDSVLAGPPGPGGRHPLPAPDRLAERLAEAGVSDDSSVVAYDDADGSVAARAWWLLRWLGLPSERVRVLDGGYAGWMADGLPVSTEIPVPARGRLTPAPGSMPVMDADAAAGLARNGLLLDARAPARYLGETEPVDPRAGHVPGARNAPFAEHMAPDGRWRPAAELAEHYRRLGVRDGTDVGAYCGSGVTASSVVLALEYAGLRPPGRPAALYTGSWSEWSADPARPVAVGPE